MTVEEILTEATEEAPILDPKDNPKVNRAAYEFGNLVEVIKSEVQSLSLRAAQRLLVTLAEYPFIKGKTKPSKKEHSILLYFLMAEQQKTIMMEAIKLSNEELTEKVLQPIAEELKQEGETSGKVD